MYWAIEGLQTLHEEGIAINNITPETLSFDENGQVRYSDFSNATYFDTEDTEGTEPKYQTKRLNKGYATPEHEQNFSSGKPSSKNQLVESDKYALAQTFSRLAEETQELFNKAGAEAKVHF